MPTYNVRSLQEADFMDVWRLAFEWEPNINPKKFVETWNMQQSLANYVLTEDDKIIGVVSYTLGENQWTGAKYCQKIHWYVGKDSRGEGMRLLEFMEQDAKNNGINEIRIGLPTGMDAPKDYEAIDVTYRKIV